MNTKVAINDFIKSKTNLTYQRIYNFYEGQLEPYEIRPIIMDYLKKNPDTVIGIRVGSDYYVLGKIMKTTMATIILDSSYKLRWSNRSNSYRHEGKLEMTINAEREMDQDF
jgi:hypothetical protein